MRKDRIILGNICSGLNFLRLGLVFSMLLLSACMGYTRKLRVYDRQTSNTVPAAYGDDQYFVPNNDMVTGTVNAIQKEYTTVEISPRHIGTDWEYSGLTAIDTGGELHTQTRRRHAISFVDYGAEMGFSGNTYVGQRVFRPKSRPSQWTEVSNPTMFTGVRSSLASLERSHLAAVRTGKSTAAALQIFKDNVPQGYQIVETSNDGLICERVLTTENVRKVRGVRGNWDAREQLILQIDSSTKDITVTAVTAHRFTHNGESSTWAKGAVGNYAAAVDWMANAFRLGIPMGDFRYGQQLLPTTITKKNGFTKPPTTPRLRTMGEIEKIISTRAVATSTGNFTVCLNTVLVSPKQPNTLWWDPPLVSLPASLVVEVSNIVVDINAAADQYPIIGVAVDAGMAESPVNRQQAALIAKIFGKVANEVKNEFQFEFPDVVGQFRVGNSSYHLQQVKDTLISPQNICHTAAFRDGYPLMSLYMADDDSSQLIPNENEHIGSCKIALSDVLRRGPSGIPCQSGRALMNAQYNFSFDQIAVVGLPPAE
jgi:hypothetical protein